MSDKITKILQAEAERIRSNNNKLTAAQHMRALADIWEKEAAPKRFSFDEIVGKKKDPEARLAQFAKAAKDDLLAVADKALTAAGWQKGASDPGTAATYIQPNSPGVKLVIEGNSFTVSQGKSIVQKKTSLGQLAEYLKQSGSGTTAPAKGTDPAMSKQVTKDLPIPATAKVDASKASMAARLKEIKKQFQS